MSTKKKALLTYLFYVMEPQFKAMIGFSVIINMLCAIFATMSDEIFPFFLALPVTLCVFLVIAGRIQRGGNWYKYVKSLPISSKVMVQADYIWILIVAIFSEFFAITAVFFIKISNKFEMDPEVSIVCLGIVFFYAVFPKIYEVETSLKSSNKKSSFIYLQGYLTAFTIHIALFFATMIPLGFMSNEGRYFTILLVILTSCLTLESYKKSIYYAENMEY